MIILDELIGFLFFYDVWQRDNSYLWIIDSNVIYAKTFSWNYLFYW